MGPFQMADLAGLDIGWLKELSRPDLNVRDRLCELGELGQKSGRSFYDYDEAPAHTPRADPQVLQGDCGGAGGGSTGDISDEEILDRLLLPMINEGAKILDEGIALRASDIDVVYVYGYGWPVYRGGPMHYANSRGWMWCWRKSVTTSSRLVTTFGPLVPTWSSWQKRVRNLNKFIL